MTKMYYYVICGESVNYIKIVFDEDDHSDVEDDDDDNGDGDLAKVPEPWVMTMLYGYPPNPTVQYSTVQYSTVQYYTVG